MEFDIINLKEHSIAEIAKFHKSSFNVDHILNNASALKYAKEIKKEINDELESPSNEFIKLFANKVYVGRLTGKVMEEFKVLVQKAFNQFIYEKINDRLNAALNKETIKQQEEKIESVQETSKVITSEEELEAYRVAIAILRRKVPVNRIIHRDTQSYFGILLDDNNRKPLCRLHRNGIKKYIGLFNENKIEIKHIIQSVDDIYEFEKELLKTIGLYEGE